MTLKELLDTYPENKRAFVVAELSWDCEDDATSRAFAAELAASGREAAAAVLDGLVGGARSVLEDAMEGRYGPVAAVSAEMRARVETLAGEFERALASSAAVKRAARERRSLLKANFDDLEGCVTDQKMGLPFPGIKPVAPDAVAVKLPPPDRSVITMDSIFDLVVARKSVRAWGPGGVSLGELSWLLWATQGLRKGKGRINFRNVPSGGSRHPFETYIAARRVEGLDTGLWRYRFVEHDLVLVARRDDSAGAFEKELTEAANGQNFMGNAPVGFIWTAIPYRTEWRYATAAPKIILQDSGHLGQNLYLAATAIGCGTCAIGAYDQKLMDALLGLDGVDEFVVYCAPVGRLRAV
jgi:SagB-type dehydrogenase family enzyme